jgi:hypothetical protein
MAMKCFTNWRAAPDYLTGIRLEKYDSWFRIGRLEKDELLIAAK